MDVKQILAGVIVGAILGLAGAAFVFQERVSKLEAQIGFLQDSQRPVSEPASQSTAAREAVASPADSPANGATVLLNTTPTIPSTNTPSAAAVLPTVTPTIPPTNTPPPTTTSTPIPSTALLSRFESGTQGWNSSESEHSETNPKPKPVELVTTSEQAHTGTQSLKVISELIGDASSEFTARGCVDTCRRTSATAYFVRANLEGIDSSPEFLDLAQQRVSCFVYLPELLITGNEHPNQVRLFVKDDDYHNHYSPELNIDYSNTERWVPLSLVIGTNEPTRPDREEFDATKIRAIGIVVEASPGSTFSGTVTFYIDDCVIEQPS